MTDFGWQNYTVLTVYLAAMIAIGLFFAKKQKTADDFFLAGRNMPWLCVAMSMFASLTSAVTYMAVPGMAYADNISILFGVLVSPIVAPILIFTFYPIYRKLNVTTSYEYILHRYGKAGRYAVSSLFILARLGWLGTVIYAPALALSVVTGIDVKLALLMMGILATAYTALGGLSAVLWTDVVQFVILVGGAIWVALSLTNNVEGGFSQIISIANQTGRLDVFNWQINFYKMTATAAALSWFFSFMQDYGTDQVTVQRLLAVKNSKGVAKAIVFNSINDVVIIALLLFIGLGLFAYYRANPLNSAAGLKADMMLPYYITSALPKGISGLVITAIFAAAMSSMDSGLHSITTVVINDFLKPLRKRVVKPSADVTLARIITILLGIFATAVAFYASTLGSIVKAWSSFMSMFAGPILAIFVLGILTRWANFKGTAIGSIISIAATFYLQRETDVHWVYYFPFSFGISFIAGALASAIIPSPKADKNLTIFAN